MKTEDVKIANAAERAAKLQGLVETIEQHQKGYGASPKSKIGRAIAHSAMSAHFRFDNDPVVWSAYIRCDVDEIKQFIQDCQKQIEDESK